MEKDHGSDRHERSTAFLKRCDRPRGADRAAGYLAGWHHAGLADSNRRSAALWRAFVSAAASEEQLAEAYADKMEAMRAESAASIRLLVSRGVYKEPANLQEMADEQWMLAHVAQYHLLVQQAGWSEERYLAWLIESMIACVRRHCG
jgi:hypothetical protein